MYLIILDEGIVVRISDNKVVSPAQSVEDIDFQQYNEWANTLGNMPKIYNNRVEMELDI